MPDHQLGGGTPQSDCGEFPLEPRHWQEWVSSGIHPDLINAALVSLSGRDALEWYLEDKLAALSGHAQQYVTRTVQKRLKRYEHLENGGWITRTRSGYSQLKPNTPGIEGGFGGKSKIRKYLNKPGEKTGLYLLPIPPAMANRIAQRYGIKLPVFTNLFEFWVWLENHPEIEITLTEGAKKAASLLSQGIVAIACPGIYNWHQKTDRDERYLHPELQSFVAGRDFYIANDQDTKPKTVANVEKATYRLGSSLLKSGAKGVQIIEWEPALGKGVDDFIVNHGIEAFNEAYRSALPFSKWASRFDGWQLNRLPSLQVNQRFLNQALPKHRVVAIKSPQGTGKTELIAQHVCRLQRDGIPAMIVTHRESLARALANRFGVEYRKERTEQGRVLGYSLCIDSLHPKRGFRAEDWEDAQPVVIIDEVEQVLWHLLNGETDIQQYRVDVVSEFKKLLQSAGQIIIADADLSDMGITSILEFAGLPTDHPVHLIKNEFQYDGFEVFGYPSGNQTGRNTWMYELSQEIKAKKRLLISTTGQKPTSKLGTTALERKAKSLRPNAKILRIDSQTLADPSHPAYGATGKDLSVLVSQYDIVIVSPALETGISIDIKGHFDAVFGYSGGNIPPTNFLQMLWRLRDLVPRHICYPETANAPFFNADGETNWKRMGRTTHQKARASMAPLLLADMGGALDEPINQIATRTWSKLAARINRHLWDYGETLRALLTRQGHQLNTPEYDVDEKAVHAVAQDFKVNRDELKVERSTAIAQAEPLGESEFKTLSESRTLTQLEQDQLEKYKLQKRYPTETVTSRLVQADWDGSYLKLRKKFFLTRGFEQLPDRELRVIQALTDNANRMAISVDVCKNTMGPEVWVLKQLGVEKFLDPNAVYTKHSPLVQEITQKLWSMKDVRPLLGNVPQKYEIKVINFLLSKIGHKLESVERTRKDGKKVRSYRLAKPERAVDEEALFEHWATFSY